MTIQPLRKKPRGPKRQKVDYRQLTHSKGVSRKTAKGRKDRAEATVTKSVRAECVDRDGHCRLGKAFRFITRDHLVQRQALWMHVCNEPSQWAHFGSKKRARTRGMAPEVRHTTAGSLMLCERAHTEYDAGTLMISALTRKGCNGPLKFSLAKA